MKSQPTLVILAILALQLTTSTEAQTLLLNGSFENPGGNPPNGGYFYLLPPGSQFIAGWTVGVGGVDYLKNGHPVWPEPTSDGIWRVDLVRRPGEGGTITQVATGLVPGTAYYLYFDLFQGEITPNTIVTATFGSTKRSFLNPYPRHWITHGVQFVATDSTATVRLAAPSAGAADTGVFVDNVRILANSLASPVLTPGVGDVEVLAGPILNPGNGHSYYLLTAGSWTASEEKAVSLGGTLALINDQKEQTFVYSIFGSYGGVNRNLWIGLRKTEPDGRFAWVDGSRLGYANWNPGEPNNDMGIEGYVHIMSPNNIHLRVPGGWNDLPDGARPWEPEVFATVYGVVEVAAPPVDEPPKLDIKVASVALSWQSQKNRQYQVQQTSASDSTAWTNLGAPVPGTGSTISMFDSVLDGPHRLYRVILLP